MPRSATGEPDDGGELREMAYRRAGVTSQWKRSTWFWSILGLAAAVLVVAGFVVPAETQAGYVLFSLAYCGLALAAVVLLMTSLRSRKGEDEQLRPSP